MLDEILVLTDGFHSDLIFLDLTVKTRPINAKHICRFLFVAAGALQRSFNYKFLDFFERHVWRYVPGEGRRAGAGSSTVIERKIDRLDAFALGEQNGALDDVLEFAYIAGPGMGE